MALVLLILVNFRWISKASILSESSIVRCNDHDDILDCDEKLVVSLSVENDRLYETDYLEVSLDGCIDDNRCLNASMTIGLTKTPVTMIYSLNTPTMFNGRPFEEYVETGHGSGLSSCVDSEFRSDVSCGWAKNHGEDIADSQGFCCKCPSFGGENIYRGFRDCSYSLSWLIDGIPSSAHCLRFDEAWWYRGYQIGTYQIDFEIQIHISRPNNESLGITPNHTETLVLSPARTIVASSQGDIVAQLLGDFAAYAEISSLEGYWLMIPVQPGSSPNQILSSNLDMWSIFQPSMVSTNGDCNKIGVSYSSFRFQSSACERPFGTCLDNQIFHFEVEDQSRIERGLNPLYNIKRYGGGTANVGQVHERSENLVLKLPLTQMRSSIVTLSMKADSITYVTHVGQAQIVSATMEDFMAIEESGQLLVILNNTSTKPAVFHVSVINCTDSVLPILEQSAALDAGGTQTFRFAVEAQTDITSMNATCSITVSNAIGVITDQRLVRFSVTSTAYDPLPNQGSSMGSNLPGNPLSTSLVAHCALIFFLLAVLYC